MQELSAEVALLLAKVKEEGASLGDSVLVVYDEEFAKEHQISSLGRMTLGSNGYEYNAGPLRIDRHCPYVADTKSCEAFTRNWVSGAKLHFDVDEFMRPSKMPVFEDEDQEKVQISDYEETLFKYMTERGHQITVVNPSMSTLARLLTYGGYATFSASAEQEKWHEDIRNFCGNSRDRIRLLKDREIIGHAYLGSASPKWYPEWHPWLHFIRNPYSHISSSQYQVREREGYVEMMQMKAGRPTHSMLLDKPPFYYQSPQTVDMALSKKGDHHPFFLACKVPYFPVDVTTSHVPHTPWFIDKLPEYEQVGSYLISHEGPIVYDVKDSGTYLSRRSMIPLPEGMEWCPLRESGLFMVTRYAAFPLAVPDVRGGPSRSIIFGEEVVVLGAPPRKFDHLIVSIPEVPFGETTLVGYHCGSPLYQFVGTPEEEDRLRALRSYLVPRGPSQKPLEGFVYDDVLRTEAGIFLRESMSTWEGYAVSPKEALAIMTGLQANKVYRLRVFSDGHFKYLESPNECYEGYWFFASLKSVRKYFPQILLYGKMWIAGQTSFRTDAISKTQVSTRLVDVRVREYLSDVRSATIPQIVTATGIGLGFGSVFQLLSKMSGIFWWSGKSIQDCRFVTEAYLETIKFPHLSQEGVPPDFYFVDGRSYREVIQHVMELGHAVLYSRDTLVLKTLAKFFRSNPFHVVSSKSYPLYSELRVRAYRW